jgi:hypothetical protein
MKKLIFLCLSVALLSGISLANDPDPILVRTGETFNFNTFHNYSWGCSSNLFKDPEGNLHGAYVDNFKLYYFISEDNGETWEVEQVITGFEGKIWNSGIVVDSEGKVFIPFAMHPNYNYGQGALGYPQFIYKIYCAVFSNEEWDMVLLQDNIAGSNQGHRLGDVLIDAEDRVHVFTERYGWNTYGGALFEIIYDPAEKSWETQTIVSYSDTPIDNFSLLSRAAINSDGDIAIMFWRHYFNRWQYAIKPAGEEWPTPEVFDTNPAFRHFSLTAGPDGEFHIAWVKGSDPFTLHYQQGFADQEPLTLYTGESGVNLVPTIHSDQADKLTIMLLRTAPNAPLIITKPSAEEDWSEEFQEFLYDGLLSAFYNVKLSQNQFSHYQTLFFKYLRQGSNGPHGPDQLFYWQAYNMKELTLVSEPEDAGNLAGAGFYNIESPVTVSAEPIGDFIFAGWRDEAENIVSTAPVFEFNMPLDHSTLTAVFQSSTSVQTGTQKPPVQIFPNPSPDGLFHIVADRELRVRVVNMNGRTVSTGRLKVGDNLLDLSGKAAGIYAFEFFGKDVSITFRVMKQ